jgi:hypothetical protein
MFSPRASLVCLVCLCASAAGCQTPSKLAALFSRKETTVAMTRPQNQPTPGQPTPGQAQVLLDAGMEVQWRVQTAEDQPGQVTSGQALVGPDGTVVVGPYGTCKVAGLSLDQATIALEQHLATYMKTPSVQLSATVSTNLAVSANQADLAWRPAPAPGPAAFGRAAPIEPAGTVVQTSSAWGAQPTARR